MGKPLVSIVSLLYDIKPEYVNACIKSLINQTYKNLEIIFIDDCSPHENYDYITKLDKRIKLVKNEKNLGMNKTAQKVFNLAKGKYVVRIDSDDYIYKTLIEKEVTFLENNPKYGAICCELKRFGKRLEHIRRPLKWDLKTILDGKYHGAGYAGGMMFRTSLLSKVSINENYKMCEDFDFHLQLLEQMPIKSINRVLYYYRSHDTNLCKTVKTEERLAINEKILKHHREIYEKMHPNTDKMDFVYIIKPGDNGEDLKYSIRSIAKQYPKNNIWIVGYKPECIKNIWYLPIEQKGTKWENSTNNVIEICKCDKISENFILMNDDFYAIKPNMPLGDLIDSNIGLLDKYVERYKNKSGEWEQGFVYINNLLNKMKLKKPFYCFEGHTPMRINKKKFLEVMNLPEVKEFMKTPNVLFKRTLYKNYDRPYKSVTLPIDVKLTADLKDNSRSLLKVCGWLSIADGLIGNKKFKDFNALVRGHIPKKCKYDV